MDDQSTAIVLDLSTGVAEVWEHPGIGIPIEEDFAAIGSGVGIAYGAFWMGATARQAVQAAILFDEGTGLGVQVISSPTSRGAR